MTLQTDSNSQISTSPDLATAWMQMLQLGASAWIDACVGGAETLARFNAAQVKTLSELAALGTAGWRAEPWFEASSGLFREELLMAEVQAERIAEETRLTLERLREGPDSLPPIPLPE